MPTPIPHPHRRHALAALCGAGLVLFGCATPSAPPAAVTKEARIAKLRSLGFTRNEDGWELSLGVKLLFDSDVDVVSEEGRQAVAELAKTLQSLGIERVRIEGHTDNVGSAKYNAALSQRRAESVAQQLVRSGLRGDTLERQGFGPDKPVADNATAAGRAQNRRVVIAVQVE